LLGGAVARSCRERKLAGKIIGFGRNAENLKQAQEAGVIDAGITDLKTAVEGSDLIILCPPVGSLVGRFQEMLPHLKAGCLVTDVGSVKGSVVMEIDDLVPEGIHFVGAHPIAGGEKTGWRASSADLLVGARCILTPTDRTHPDALETIRSFWELLGMQVMDMSTEEHDAVYAAVSHLPHVVAYALMNTVADTRTENHKDVFSLSAGGLRDITRIASGDPVLWKDICLANKKQVLDMIEKFESALGTVKALIEGDQEDELEQNFARAKQQRERIGDNSK